MLVLQSRDTLLCLRGDLATGYEDHLESTQIQQRYISKCAFSIRVSAFLGS